MLYVAPKHLTSIFHPPILNEHGASKVLSTFALGQPNNTQSELSLPIDLRNIFTNLCQTTLHAIATIKLRSKQSVIICPWG